jgi:hypothetical protein
MMRYSTLQLKGGKIAIFTTYGVKAVVCGVGRRVHQTVSEKSHGGISAGRTANRSATILGMYDRAVPDCEGRKDRRCEASFAMPNQEEGTVLGTDEHLVRTAFAG